MKGGRRWRPVYVSLPYILIRAQWGIVSMYQPTSTNPIQSLMKTTQTSYLGLWSQALLFFHYHIATCEQQILAPQARLRNATLADADAIVTIIIAAFASLPSFQYLYTCRHAFPQEHRECVRFGITKMLSDPTAHTEVIEAPAGSDIPLVAIAAWTQKNTGNQSFLRKPPGKS